MTYKQTMNYENVQKVRYTDCSGPFDIPNVEALKEYRKTEFIGFNYALQETHPERYGVHFWLDDYQFQRLWNRPERYVDLLKKFKYVCMPDFSMYTDFPVAINIYNKYRNHWLAKYWQELGVNVIPTVLWSDEASHEWAFDGMPKESVICVSSLGCAQSRKATELFQKGFCRMMKELHPIKIVYFGKKLIGDDDYDCDIEWHKNDYESRFSDLALSDIAI